MTRSGLIFATIVSLTLATPETRFKKCCPPGEMFCCLTTRPRCVPANENALELYNVDDDYEVTGYTNEFPICEQPEDVNTLLLTAQNSTDFLQEPPGCIEILHMEHLNESALVAVNCRSNRNRTVEYEQPATKASSLQLFNIRRCCPRDRVFDVITRSCVTNKTSAENVSLINEFVSLLPKPPGHARFFNVSKGWPVCHKGALVTYEVKAEDISFEEGSLRVTVSVNGSREKIPASIDDSCLELTPNSRTSRELVFRVCRNSDFCQNHSCVRKCCREGYVLSRTFHCTNAMDASSVQSAFYGALSNLTDAAWDNSTGYSLLIGRKCTDLYRIDLGEIVNVTKEGQLRQVPTLINDLDSYCLDMFENGSVQSLICFQETEPNPPKIKYIIMSLLEVVSCVFLVLTLLVYMFIPSLQNLHGKTLMCHAVSLLVSYICLAIIPWVTPPSRVSDISENIFCSVLGYGMLLSLLSAFCWLNVMCFDIWRTFGRLRGNYSGGHSQGKRFLLYSIYAWGLALFITLFCIASDKMTFMPDNVKPNFGQLRCWFSNNMIGELIFFRTPVAIQLTSNVVFFVLTSEHCSKVKAEISRVADPSDPRSKRFHADKTKLIMNVKLFIVMGILWIAEVASSLMNTYSTYDWKEIVFYWSDALNCLHGLLIFILFVLKPRVYQALKKRLGFRETKKCSSQGTSTIQDPSRVKKSASNSTLTSSLAVSSVP